VVDESSAILVDPLDIEAIAAGLRDLKRNEVLRRRLGESALERARRTDLAARAGHIRNWLESVVGSQPR
jgi:glycosyltransferase involved in cell wall biosynthesis